MGSDQSKASREHEFVKLEIEREELRRARTEQLQEISRLEKEKNLYRQAREDLEARQLQEALSRSHAETQRHLYPNLNHIAGVSTNETYQTNVAPTLAVNHDHYRYQPSAPPVPATPTVYQPLETRAPPPRPCPPTINKLATETGVAHQSATGRASVTAPQSNTGRASVTAPQSNTGRASVTAPQSNTGRSSVTGLQSNTGRASVTAPQSTTGRASVTAPQSNTGRSSVTGLQSNTGRASVTAPQSTTGRASETAPHEKRVFTRKDNNQSCQTCKKPYEDKIFQCKNGHSACESCWSLDVPCGQCNGPIINKRNFDLENHITANRSVKCPNAADGCKLSFKKPELAKHARECPFKELKCPALDNCNWSGKLRQLSIHFDEEHSLSRQANVDTEMYLQNISNEYNSLQLIKLGTYNFLFYIKVSEIERCVYMDIQLIGTKISASKWHYEIHVYNKSQPRRKYQYINTCQSSNETSGISMNSCVVLPLSYAWSFVNDGKLTYKIFIKKNINVNQKNF